MPVKQTRAKKERPKSTKRAKSVKKLRKTGELKKKTADNREKPRNKKFTPQQIDFAMRYYLPNSPTYGNVLQSALKAGYSPKYAKSGLTTRGLEWVEKILLEIVGISENSNIEIATKEELIKESKRVISETLKGQDKVLAQKSAVFVLKSDPEFSEKKDVTSGGEKIEAPVALVEFVDGKENPDTDAG